MNNRDAAAMLKLLEQRGAEGITGIELVRAGVRGNPGQLAGMLERRGYSIDRRGAGPNAMTMRFVLTGHQGELI